MPNLTSVGITAGVPTSGTGTVSTIDELIAVGVPLPPNAAQETGGNLASVVSNQGASGTGITQPTGGSGILGWLSGIYNKLSNSLAVTGTFWQTTQPVSIATMPSTPVTGTFWQTTQPVSASSLPLPTGAATSALQTTINSTLGSPMQNSGGSVSVSNFPGTQPVSIATMPSTPVTGTFFQTTQPVSIASMPTTPVTGTFFQATQPISSASEISDNITEAEFLYQILLELRILNYQINQLPLARANDDLLSIKSEPSLYNF